MWKYVRLLRLEDQYPVFGCAIAAGIFPGLRDAWILWWAFASVLISIGTFLLNELIDRRDVDRYSWNPVHVGNKTKINEPIAWILYGICTLGGLWIAWQIGLGIWGIALGGIGALYSLPYIRLKGVPVLDILVQMLVWVIIPFAAPLSVTGMLGSALPFIIAVAFWAWAVVFPYQLADFSADKKAGLHPTHVWLGIPASLVLGVIMALVGGVVFFTNHGFARAWWLSIFPVIALAPVVLTPGWIRLRSISKQEAAFQHYVRWMKPFTQLLIPYVLVLWLLL